MKKFLCPAVFLLLLLVSSVCPAITIESNLTSLGGSTYRYEYTVINDGSLGAGINVKLFDISFDTGLYEESSLLDVSDASLAGEWMTQFLASAPDIPASFDAVALCEGVADRTSGFAVQFDWVGGGYPSRSQNFFIYDPESFDLIASGTTIPYSSVPEPGTLILIGLGLVATVFGSRKLKAQL